MPTIVVESTPASSQPGYELNVAESEKEHPIGFDMGNVSEAPKKW